MRYIYMLPAAILVPAIHEWVKAMVSAAQGDPAPRKHGYLTANPFRYLEPIGFIFILFCGFGWGRPAPTTALHYRDRQRGVILTYTIPVLVNLLLGVVAVLGVRILAAGMVWPSFINLRHHITFYLFTDNWFLRLEPNYIVALLLAHFAILNINMAIFNLIPVFPLAANKLMLTFSNPDTIARLNHYEKPMQVILILLLVLSPRGLGFGGDGLLPHLLSFVTDRIVSIAWGLGI